MLRAAGVDLDAPSQVTPTESQRYSGIVLSVMIEYDNIWSFDAESYRYRILPEILMKSEYKVEDYIDFQSVRFPGIGNNNNETPAQSLVLDRHGVRMVFALTGRVGVFDGQQLLINLASSLGLFAVAQLVADMIMKYFMPHKDAYRKYKFLETEDFSDYRDALKQSGAVPLLERSSVDKDSPPPAAGYVPPEKKKNASGSLFAVFED